MIRSELVSCLAELNPQLHARDAEAVVDTILGRIEAALATGDRVELRDFGTFSVRHRERAPDAICAPARPSTFRRRPRSASKPARPSGNS